MLFLLHPTHSQVYFFCLPSMWSLWMCSTSLSIFSISPAWHPSQAHVVTCSWFSSSSQRVLTGELGTSPSVSSDTCDISSRGSTSGATTAEEAVDPSPIFCRFGGGRSSIIDSSSNSSEELIDESGESGGESFLAIVTL